MAPEVFDRDDVLIIIRVMRRLNSETQLRRAAWTSSRAEQKNKISVVGRRLQTGES